MELHFDGWELYKRRKVPYQLVRKYCLTLDSDYCKHKITVCAHLGAILDLYNFQRKPFMAHQQMGQSRTTFNSYSQISHNNKEMKPQNY